MIPQSVGRRHSAHAGAVDGGSADDLLSRVYQITDGTASEVYARYSYLGAGTIVSVEHPAVQGGLRLSYDPAGDGSYGGWDRFGQIVSQAWRADDGTVVDGYSYSYDRAGNRTSRGNVLNSSLSESYAYDGLDRLIDTDRGEMDHQSWDLDSLGNWASFTDQGTSQTRTANSANEITSISGTWVTPEYDAAGNMTVLPQPGDPASPYTAIYDAWNRLAEVKEGEATVAVYEYDGLNRRITKTAGGTTTDFFYNENWQVLEEVASSPQSVASRAQYVWDIRYIDSPVLRDRDTDGNGTYDQRLFFTTDANWNVTALVAPDSGDPVEYTGYDNYGKPLFFTADWTPISSSAYGNQVLFGGYRYDPETLLYHVRNRYYHPSLGTWLSRDPEGYKDGMNLAAYVGSSPTEVTDPMGLFISGCNRKTQSPQSQWLYTYNAAKDTAPGTGYEGGKFHVKLESHPDGHGTMYIDMYLLVSFEGTRLTDPQKAEYEQGMVQVARDTWSRRYQLFPKNPEYNGPLRCGVDVVINHVGIQRVGKLDGARVSGLVDYQVMVDDKASPGVIDGKQLDLRTDSVLLTPDPHGSTPGQVNWAHEFGHLLGLSDEYLPQYAGATYLPAWTGDSHSIMNRGMEVRPRHYTVFSEWLNRHSAALHLPPGLQFAVLGPDGIMWDQANAKADYNSRKVRPLRER